MTNRDEPATAITSDFHHTLELLRAARDGERAALEALFERYRDRVLEIVRIRLGPRLRQAVESTDLAQEAMLRPSAASTASSGAGTPSSCAGSPGS